MDTFYAQFETDKIISDFFSNKSDGVCIDIGAAQPIWGNNTYYFEAKGWEVYCVEPNNNLFNQLKSVRKKSFNFACGSFNSESVDFTVCTLNSGNQEAVSSLNIDPRLIETHEQYNPEYETTRVELRTLNNFLEQQKINNIDFISIDTEGTEIDVLLGLDLLKYKPKLLVIENNFEDQVIESYLINFGYRKFLRNVVNDFYTFDDSIELPSHPIFRYYTRGNFGDMIHQLWIIKNIYNRTGIKGSLYLTDKDSSISNGFFLRSINHVVDEVKKILTEQNYLEDMGIYDLDKNTDINLSSWRDSTLLFKKSWIEIFSHNYNLLSFNKIEPWLKINEKDLLYKNTIIIHESSNKERKFESFPWEQILNNNDCLFVSFDDDTIESFKFKNKVKCYKMRDFEECCLILNSCKLYIGNLTAITAIAHAMGVPRLIELYTKNSDYIHYIGEKKYFDNFWYLTEDKEVNFLDGLVKLLNV